MTLLLAVFRMLHVPVTLADKPTKPWLNWRDCSSSPLLAVNVSIHSEPALSHAIDACIATDTMRCGTRRVACAQDVEMPQSVSRGESWEIRIHATATVEVTGMRGYLVTQHGHQ